MANIPIKHSTITFEKMDEDDMYVNATAAASIRKKIDTNYQNIVNAWKKIETSFNTLQGASSGKVQQMFSQAVSAAKAKKSNASKRKSELDGGLKNDVKEYARSLLDIKWMEDFIKRL